MTDTPDAGTPADEQPSTGKRGKNIRVSDEVHARIQRLAAELNCSHNAAIAFMLSSDFVRVPVDADKRRRWKAAADAAGQYLGEFIAARVDCAIQTGADPGVLRRVHDMVYALTRAAGVMPRQYLPTPGAAQQVVSDTRREPPE